MAHQDTKNYVKYHLPLRRIVGARVTADPDSGDPDIVLVEGRGTHESHYVDATDPQELVLKKREPNPARLDNTDILADGASEAVIARIPAGTRADVYVDGRLERQMVIDDGELRITSTAAATLGFLLSPAGKYWARGFSVEAA